MLEIVKREKTLFLEYRPEYYSDSSWIDKEMEEKGEVSIYRVFTFLKKNLVADEEEIFHSSEERVFVLGVLDGDYYRISKGVLGLNFDLLLHKGMRITRKTFLAEGRVSIFKKIDILIDEPIVIGGDSENAIPVTDFETLLVHFPTKTTLNHYAGSRISGILKEYLGTITDAQKKLNEHLRRQGAIKGKSQIDDLRMYEITKYQYIYDSIVEMLKDSESPSEEEWQKNVVKFLLLIFPKYVAVLEKVHIKDFYSEQTKPIDRFIDLTLVDANGNIDIVEIKKPFIDCILSSYEYRDNYTPKKELSGAVMQAEKYIFHLNKWGVEGEKEINKKWASKLPNGMQVKITNPKAMIIIGRDNDFKNDKKFDFEIIKRKYANVIDIMSYDDLLQRLRNIIGKLKQK